MGEYQHTIDEQLRYGITEPVDNSDESSDMFIHYMPHHLVVKQDCSTTKVHTVYVGLATTCLNQEIQFLLTHKGACPILVHQFDLFIGDVQLIHCQGRMNNSELSLASKKLVLLSTKHPSVILLIRQAHEHSKHGGVSEMKHLPC